MLGVTLLSKEPQLISLKYHEMLLVTLSLSFEITVAGVFDDVLL